MFALCLSAIYRVIRISSNVHLCTTAETPSMKRGFIMKNTPRLAALGAAFALIFATGCGESGGSDGEFPSSNVTVIVPYDAGGNVDTQARALAPCFEERWDNRVLVENQPGSAGTIGTRALANAEPDGYTLSLNSVSPYVLGPRLVDNAGYTSDDLRSFGYATAAPILFFVDGDADFESMSDVVEAAQSESLVASAPGADSLQALLVEQLNANYDTNFNVVPTDSTNEIVRGVSEGDYHVGVTATSLDILPRIESGEIKLLARGGDEAYQYFEGVETYEQAGYDDLLPYTDITIPLIGPAGIPDEVAEEIEAALESCLQEEDVISGLGEEITPPEFIDGEQATEEYTELGEAIDAMQ